MFGGLLPAVHAQTNAPDTVHSATAFLGEASCSSSGCHGGAGEKRDQCIRWSKLDVHVRSYATLTRARSARIADVLKISDATTSPRCTVCHAPFQSIAIDAVLTKALDPLAGVSCESCHGPAGNWLLSHTRPDFTHEDRVRAGMRDLKNLYARANTCVACHQNVDADILRAGHPELIFELDGQSVSEPKHWREPTDWAAPQTWLVGQAVALRDMSWQLTNETAPTENARERVEALAWLLQSVGKANSAWLTGDVASAQAWSDALAREAARGSWTQETTHKCLGALADTGGDFRAASLARGIQARRAERLVLALDRLATGLDDASAKRLDAALNQLFKDAQSLPDFDALKFAGHLDGFKQALAAMP